LVQSILSEQLEIRQFQGLIATGKLQEEIHAVVGSIREINKKKIFSPVSRILFPEPVSRSPGRCHLSGRTITGAIYLPTLRRESIAAFLNGPLSTTGLHGISAYKVYPHHPLLENAVGSYPTFSPFPSYEGSYFLWHYL